MKTATYIKHVEGIHCDARLYQLSEPVKYVAISDDLEEIEHETRFIVVLAVITYSGQVTFIFPADDTGHVLNWGELPGTYRGGLNHFKALTDAGYQVIDEIPF